MYLEALVKKVENMDVLYQREKNVRTDFKFYQDEPYKENKREINTWYKKHSNWDKKSVFDSLISRLKRAKERMSKHESSSIEINYAKL